MESNFTDVGNVAPPPPQDQKKVFGRYTFSKVDLSWVIYPPPPGLENYFWKVLFFEGRFELGDVPPHQHQEKCFGRYIFLKVDLSWVM